MLTISQDLQQQKKQRPLFWAKCLWSKFGGMLETDFGKKSEMKGICISHFSIAVVK